MFYIKYLTMYKVHMHAGAISKLLYGCLKMTGLRSFKCVLELQLVHFGHLRYFGNTVLEIL